MRYTLLPSRFVDAQPHVPLLHNVSANGVFQLTHLPLLKDKPGPVGGAGPEGVAKEGGVRWWQPG
jgi:hypothetical protein